MNRQELEEWRAQVDRDWEERARQSLKRRLILKTLVAIYAVLYVILIVGLILDGQSRK